MNFAVDWQLFYTVLHISVNLRPSSLQWDQSDKNRSLYGRVTLNWILTGLKEKVTNFNNCTQLSPMFKKHYCLSLADNLRFQRAEIVINRSSWGVNCCPGSSTFGPVFHITCCTVFCFTFWNSIKAYPKIGCNFILGYACQLQLCPIARAFSTSDTLGMMRFIE